MLPAPLLLTAVLAPADAPTPPPDTVVSDAGGGVRGTPRETKYRTDFGGE